jgi:hypothetical protein
VNRSATTLIAVAFGLCIATSGQQNHFPTPPEPMDPDSRTAQQSPAVRKNVNLAEAQREADDLARTAQTIPSDVASVRKGMLPKDVIEKLKQIEKLSKHLRSELTP